MLRAGLVLALLVTSGGDQKQSDSSETTPQRMSRDDRMPRSGGRSFSFTASSSPSILFSFAPTGGAGMGSACAGTTPTGAKGETLTFTRATAATCLKGNTTTGIANGDMVKLTSGQPAIMPGGDGTGALGLLVEEARTNSCLRSEQFGDAVWNAFGGTITITSDAAVAPDGTTTADRLQVPATTAGNVAYLYQLAACPVGTVSASTFVKGVSGSGTVGLHINLGGGNFACAQCSYNSSTWSRCTISNATVASSGNIFIGNDSSDTGTGCDSSAHGAQDVYAWGIDCEAGAFPTSYIPTAGTAATRNLVNAKFASVPWSGATFSKSAFVEIGSGRSLSGTNSRAATLFWDSSLYDDSYFPGNYSVFFYTGSTNTVSVSASVTTSGKVGTYYDGTNLGGFIDSTSNSSAASISNSDSSVTIQLGTNAAGGSTGALNGVIKQVCLDTTATGCR